MAVITGSDGSISLNFGAGLKYVANVFDWEARLRRESLRQTTQADDYEKRTVGMGDWSGSVSFRLEFSDDQSIAQSAWQVMNFAISNTDDNAKAALSLVLQRYKLQPDYEIFRTTVGGIVKLTGSVVIADLSVNCNDPEQPIVCVAGWEADGALTLARE